jgi:hypothetical protein
MRIKLLSIFVLIGLAVNSYGQNRDSVRVKRVYTAKNIGLLMASLRIDGKMEDKVWSLVEWPGDFIE